MSDKIKWVSYPGQNLIKSCELTETIGKHDDLRYHCDDCGKDYGQVDPTKNPDLTVKILHELPDDIGTHVSDFIWDATCECGSKSFSYRKDEGVTRVLDRWDNDNYWGFSVSPEKQQGYANMVGIPLPFFQSSDLMGSIPRPI